MMKRTTSILLLILTLVLGYTCGQENENKKIIEGDLYFGFLRLGSFYNQPDSLISKFKIYADTVNRDNLTSDDKNFLTTYELLKKENLLDSPFIELRLKNDSIINLYLDKSDYNKIKIYKRKRLQDDNKKIKIVAESKDLEDGIALCTKLISVEKIDGVTLQVQKKFEIEDYE